MRQEKPKGELKRGWTTGACAAAAAKAALLAIKTGKFPATVTITLPGGEQPVFVVIAREKGDNWAKAGIIKDAGDDPDVTHGCMVVVKLTTDGTGIRFQAGEGVGTITKPGLALDVGEPAINPKPRMMIARELQNMDCTDAEVEISIPGGQELALKTWNGRLGIIGGLSILGTTGIVNPYSCAAWIASIHRGIDVARATGLTHVAGCTGSTTEAAVQAHFGLPLEAMLDMGDFAGGVLKYIRANPIARVTIAGGFGKMVKLAQGHLDLHSNRSQVDFGWLAQFVEPSQQAEVISANTALEVLQLVGPEIAIRVAKNALQQVEMVLGTAAIQADVMIVDRSGAIIAHAI